MEPIKLLEPPEPEALESEHEARKEREAEEAAQRVRRGNHWLDWLAIGEGLVIGRLKAMRRAGTNQPMGATYNRAFGEWMDAHQWARDLDKAARNHAMWAADNRDAIERWRETLAANVRAMINHPTTTKRRFEAAFKVKADGVVRQSLKEKFEAELLRLEEENTALRKRLDKEGSLFDLKQDSVKTIAATIAGSVTPYRLGELAKALLEEQKRRKAEMKHAG